MFEPEALELLQRQDWPGNVRELENAVIRLATLSAGPKIRKEDVQKLVVTGRAKSQDGLPTLDLQELERMALREALSRHGNNKRAAAAELGVSLKTIYNKMGRYGLG